LAILARISHHLFFARMNSAQNALRSVLDAS
jgi:hypothetical protein